jgi:hypothetical protein
MNIMASDVRKLENDECGNVSSSDYCLQEQLGLQICI